MYVPIHNDVSNRYRAPRPMDYGTTTPYSIHNNQNIHSVC